MDHEADKPRFDMMMLTRIISLLRIAHVFPTGLVLIGLAVVEVLVGSLVGKIAGQVYQVYVDKDRDKFRVILGNVALLYAAIVLVISLGYGTGQMLAIQWRGRLVNRLHTLYFRSNTFCHLQGVPSKVAAQPPADGVRVGMGNGLPVTALATPRAAGGEVEHLLSGAGDNGDKGPPLGRLDNPDQRMTQDVIQFCDKFEKFLRKTAKSPFNLIVYTYLVVNLFGSILPVLCAVAYFFLFAILQKIVMSTMAEAINTYQQCEGDLRAAHMRVRVDAGPIASWGGAAVEERNVNTSLYLTLSAQMSMAWTFILQYTLAEAGDYYAVAVNYGIIGFAVFVGTFTQDAESGGAAASDVSQASFYLIMLMHSLTSILDATKELGEVAGHTARIHNFLKQMESISPDKGHGEPLNKPSPFSPRIPSQPGGGRDGQTLLASSTHVVDVASPGSQSRPIRRVLSDTLNRRRPPSEELDTWHTNEAESVFGGTLPEYLKDQASTLLPPTSGLLSDGSAMEVSVHKLGTDELGEIVGNVFPDVPSGSQLLAVCTFQAVPSLGTVVLRPTQAKEKQMAGLLKRYLSWEGSVRANLQAHGFWCDSVHPQTGFALYSTQGAKYSEAIGAQVFCQYQVRNEGGLSIIVHPTYGTKVYPVTFFTTAPYVSLLAAVTKACTLERNEQSTQWQYATLDRPDFFPLLAVHDVTISDGGSEGEPEAFARCAARNFSFEVPRDRHVVINGSPGIGKSTLLSAIRGLTKIQHGVIKWCPGVRAMFVPQLSVVAPDATLSAQVSYPSLQLCSHEDAVHALTAVGLGYLVERFEKGATSEDFFNLSKGELQCMGIARILHAKPDLVMLDEALSAVPVTTELRLLDLLAQAGITMLIVSHRDEVRQVASSILTLDTTLTDGWKLDHVH